MLVRVKSSQVPGSPNHRDDANQSSVRRRVLVLSKAIILMMNSNATLSMAEIITTAVFEKYCAAVGVVALPSH